MTPGGSVRAKLADPYKENNSASFIKMRMIRTWSFRSNIYLFRSRFDFERGLEAEREVCVLRDNS